jgi:hypothetical protein
MVSMTVDRNDDSGLGLHERKVQVEIRIRNAMMCAEGDSEKEEGANIQGASPLLSSDEPLMKVRNPRGGPLSYGNPNRWFSV